MAVRETTIGRPPTRANEDYLHGHESGGPFSARNTVDSLFRGNDAIGGGADQAAFRKIPE